MDIAQIVSIGVMGTMLTVMLKKYSPEISLVTAFVTGILILMIVIQEVFPVVDIFKRMASVSGIDNEYIAVVLKVVVISYIAEFGVQLCGDAGVKTVASKIELAGKVLIMIVSAPVFIEFLEKVISLV